MTDAGVSGEMIGDDGVKKLPTIGRTIDRSRKYRPMENLSEAPNKSRKSGLDRLRKMKNDMFGGKKDHREEEEVPASSFSSSFCGPPTVGLAEWVGL
jgi:hypothetical protein